MRLAVLLAICSLIQAPSLLSAALQIQQGASPTKDEQIEFFESRIRPILVERCYECHSLEASVAEGGLRVDSRVALLRGGDNGPAIVPSDSSESLLLDAIRYESLEMPPDGKLSDAEIADIQRWIEQGAVDPRVEEPSSTQKRDVSIDFESGREFWAFQTPVAQRLPRRPEQSRPRNRIDSFIDHRLDVAGITPNPPADRLVLIRRLSYDLTGLPPSPDDVERFLNDDSPDATTRLIDRLLASPHYGERWTQLWLDVARYAEDQAHIVGNNKSLFFPNAYRYRDWVIESFNQDMAYDRFLQLQLAADLLEGDDSSDRVALGFLGLGPKYYRRNSPEVMADEWEDRVDTISRGLLGLTVACARCHDHKYDPISTEDYYALAGVFASTEMFNEPLSADAATNKDGNAKEPGESLHIVREGKPRDLKVMIRGDVDQLGELVPRRFLQVLADDEPQAFTTGSGRLELADSITSPQNPLTARVIVNRVWGELFGRPLVATPSNFGSLGSRPSHPELLDDLTARFMSNDWSLKWLQREIVSSAAYQRSSALDEHHRTMDPENVLLWRMPRRRLSIEAWRDTMLSISGQLANEIGGHSIKPSDLEQTKRTVYSERSRFQLDRMLSLFDAPDPNAHSAQRVETVTPLQKLFVLNSPFMVSQAHHLVRRIDIEAGDNNRVRIEYAYQLLFGRPPSSEELKLGLAFLTDSEDENESWEQYAQVLLAANELLIVD